MKLTFLLAIIFSSFLFCQSQNTIKVAGIVKSIDGEILNGANIICKNIKKGTSSSINGEYILVITRGNNFVYCSYLGFQNDSVLANFVNDTIINFTLKPISTVKAEVVISATKPDANLSKKLIRAKIRYVGDFDLYRNWYIVLAKIIIRL